MSSVPVSQYEALRAEMRNLVEQAQKVQDIATQVISTTSSTTSINSSTTTRQICANGSQHVGVGTQQPFGMEVPLLATQPPHELNFDVDGDYRSSSAQMSVSSEPTLAATTSSHPNNLYHGTWPVEQRTAMWATDPSNLTIDNSPRPSPHHHLHHHHHHTPADQASVLSFASSSGGAPLDRVLGSPDRLTRRSMQQLEAKVDMVYSLLAMLGGQEHADMGDTLLALSTSPESCLAMRQSGCIPLLVQLVQSDKDRDTRQKASQALHNLIYAQPDEKARKREIRVQKLLEQTSGYVEAVRNNTEFNVSSSSSTSASESSTDQVDDKHPVSIVANLMKHSFDEGHRQAICQLGGIQTIAAMVETEHTLHGSGNDNTACILMRRYACMALTNLTFGDSGNKALLCSHREFMRALVVQLQSPSDELRQVTASVLRNLSWRADQSSKDILREVGTVTGLMKAGMATAKENTLKSILSALWNLSAQCTENKLEICAVENGLGFLVDMLSYKAPSTSLTINENAGGILRNISSQIAVRDDYREILRKHNCLQILLDQLKSPSLTIVSNACGTLWNLSAKNQIDQEALWQMGAPTMLRSLNHSKHKMIATGSSAALKNLLNSRPSHSLVPQLDSTARAMDLPALPTLGVRKQKALMRDLDANLAETFENIERDSPTKVQLFDKAIVQQQQQPKKRTSKEPPAARNESHEFVARGELPYEEETALANGFGNMSIADSSTSYKPRYGNTTYREKNYFVDDDGAEQPIDYSRKYSETPKTNVKGKEKVYDGIYAETDLDQPTDYSLRYAEDDSDSDCGLKKQGEFVRDSVKTYYTEGTPYVTPVNFSTATSMSDLRIVDIDNDKTKDSHKETKAPTLSHLDEKDHCSVEDITDLENTAQGETTLQPLPRSEFSSGLMSPEKPVNYCEEGTPGYFSRVSSFGSLNSIPANQEIKKEAVTPPPAPLQDTKKVPASPAEPKVVKFGASVNYAAEQTPLMFSRSSSLASLDSVEQHSIHDDRSSVVSDFSRLTSGIVSPSELPDSPTQTVPPSPRPRKAIDYPSTSRFRAEGRPQPAPRNLIQKPSVFEDHVTKFKEESTPVQFSTATSISSLTIDDQDEPVAGDIKVPRTKPASSALGEEEDGEKQDVQEKPDSSSELFNGQISENDEDDDILADCINIGMQNNRHRHAKPSSSKIPALSSKAGGGRPHGSGIPIPRTGIPTARAPIGRSKPTSPTAHADSVRTYCTEDTPAVLSHAGSNSDLSALSMQTDNKSSRKDYLSDDSSNLSGDNDNILAECIQSAMPKAKTSFTSAAKRQVAGASGSTPRVSTSTPIKPFTARATATKSTNHLANTLYVSARDELSNFAVENSPCQFSLRSSLSDLTVDGSVAGVRTLGEGETEPDEKGGRRSANTSGPSTTVHNTTGTSCNTTAHELSRQESLSSLSVESYGSIETEQALLEQCISSGMPKSKQTPPEKPIGVATKQFGRPIGEKENEAMSKSKNVNAASAAESTRSAPKRSNPTTIQAADVDASINRAGDSTLRTTSSASSHSNAPAPLVKSSHTEENLLTALTKSGCEKSLGKMLDGSVSTSSYSNSDNCANLERSDEEVKSTSIAVDSRMLDPDAMIESLDRFTAELVSQATQNKEENKCSASLHADAGGDTWNEDATFPSISGSVPNVITFSEEKIVAVVAVNKLDVVDGPASNDFSSLNTTSTLTESTLIAMEATKMAMTFQQEAEMSKSNASVDLEHMQPPSHMNSIDSMPTRSPRASRKRSLPVGLMVRRALSNSLNQAGSLESLIGGATSVTNLEQMNPPSLMNDMDGSLISVASIPSDAADQPNPIFDVKQPMAQLLACGSNVSHSVSNLENINPPSLFNEMTDLCNSLADVTTDFETANAFDDCTTYQQTENDVTEFSDANSITPIQSDASSADSTPKKTRSLTPKQRRSVTKERYLTYTVAKEEVSESTANDYQTCADVTVAETTTYSTATYTRSPKRLTPKEKRQQDAARFQTQTICTNPTIGNSGSDTSSGSRKVNQRRAENKDRFRTQTIVLPTVEPQANDMLHILQQEAKLVLKSLNETRSDELLDETLSLVSNDDDSEMNSRCSMTYRTYRKSSSTSATPIPVIPPPIASQPEPEDEEVALTAVPAKPKIVKPGEKQQEEASGEQQVEKAIRGRRKPLYAKTFRSTSVRAVTPPRVAARPPPAQPKLQKAKTAPLQREGTFTKEEKKKDGGGSRIPSAIPKAASTSRIAKLTTAPATATTTTSTRSKLPSLSGRANGLVKSASSDRANKPLRRIYQRSPSADSRIAVPTTATTTTSSTSPKHVANGAVKKTPTPTNNPSKQITSRIASLWKQVEESKKQPTKKDTRVWIQPQKDTEVEVSENPRALPRGGSSRLMINGGGGDIAQQHQNGGFHSPDMSF